MTHAVMAFGRMNPPTVGHEKLISKVKGHAKSVGGDAHIIVSHSEDKKNNPIPQSAKLKYISKVAGTGAKVRGSSKQSPSIMHHASDLHKKGYEHLTVVAGSDRISEFKKTLTKYNGVKGRHGHYNFKSINVVSSGNRDPDAKGTTGISGTKMREHAHKGDHNSFKKGLPKALHPHAEEIMGHIKESNELDFDTISEDDYDFTDDEMDMFLEFEYDTLDDIEIPDFLDEAVRTFQQRIKMARRMKRLAPRMARFRKIRAKRMAPQHRLSYRARKAALQLVRRRTAGSRGANYANLSISQKISVDKAIEKKRGLIKRIAQRLMPKVRKKEIERLRKARSGAGSKVKTPGQTHVVKKKSLGAESYDQEFETYLEEGRRGRPRKNPVAGDDDGGREHIVMQLRKSVSLKGQKHVEFNDDKKVQVSHQHAAKALSMHARMKPQQKSHFEKHMSMSHDHFKDAVSGKPLPKKHNPITNKADHSWVDHPLGHKWKMAEEKELTRFKDLRINEAKKPNMKDPADDMLLSILSDVYKDVTGSRPRSNNFWNQNKTYGQVYKTMDDLQKQLIIQIKQERHDKKRSKLEKAKEKAIQARRSFGKPIPTGHAMKQAFKKARRNEEVELDERMGKKIAVLDGPDGSVTIYKTSKGYYGDTGDFDFERKTLKDLKKTLDGWGYRKLVYGSLKEEVEVDEVSEEREHVYSKDGHHVHMSGEGGRDTGWQYHHHDEKTGKKTNVSYDPDDHQTKTQFQKHVKKTLSKAPDHVHKAIVHDAAKDAEFAEPGKYMDEKLQEGTATVTYHKGTFSMPGKNDGTYHKKEVEMKVPSLGKGFTRTGEGTMRDVKGHPDHKKMRDQGYKILKVSHPNTNEEVVGEGDMKADKEAGIKWVDDPNWKKLHGMDLSMIKDYLEHKDADIDEEFELFETCNEIAIRKRMQTARSSIVPRDNFHLEAKDKDDDEEEKAPIAPPLEHLLRLAFKDKSELQKVRRALKGGKKSLANPQLRTKLMAVLDMILSVADENPSVYKRMRSTLQKRAKQTAKPATEGAFLDQAKIRQDREHKRDKLKHQRLKNRARLRDVRRTVARTAEEKALQNKAVDNGFDTDTIFEVYCRGLEQGNDSKRAFDRVNSFIAGGKARELDSDLLDESTAQRMTAWKNLRNIKKSGMAKSPKLINKLKKTAGIPKHPSPRSGSYSGGKWSNEDIERDADFKMIKAKNPNTGKIEFKKMRGKINIGKGVDETIRFLPDGFGAPTLKPQKPEAQRQKMAGFGQRKTVRQSGMQKLKTVDISVKAKSKQGAIQRQSKPGERTVQVKRPGSMVSKSVPGSEIHKYRSKGYINAEREHMTVSGAGEWGTPELANRYASDTPGQIPGVHVAFKDYVKKPEVAPTARQIERAAREEKENG